MTESTSTTVHPTLRAIYSSSNDSKIFPIPLNGIQPTDTASKVQFLSNLRASTKQLQDNINTFLTAKMEEDKAASSSTTNGSSTNIKKRDEEEEENYGEEKIDED